MSYRRLLAIVLTVVACAVLTAATSVPAAAQDSKPLDVIVFPGGSNWPIWVAQDKGLFARNGVAVKARKVDPMGGWPGT